MAHEPPAIVKLSERILLEVELAARRFSRANRYSVGAELRNDAREVARRAHKAWRQRDRRTHLLEELADGIDNLKLTVQLAKSTQSFASFAQFEAIIRLVNDLGRQCGGWQRQHLRGQNQRAATPAGRAEILSARDAPAGVNA